MILDRRALLAGIGTAACLPASRARAAGDVGGLLDAAAAAEPAEGVRLLTGIDATILPAGARLDIETARAGLAIEVALARDRNDYTLRLRRQLGDAADPEDAEQRLVRELDRLTTRTRMLFDTIGLAGRSVGACYRQLWQDERWLYEDGAAGRDAALADMNRMLADERRRVAVGFVDVPPFCLDVTVRGLSPADIAAGKNGYREVPSPGEPGAYVVDLKEVRRRPRWTLDSVVAHELLPGHMIQLGIEAQEPPHPLRITYAGAFVEGWGIYAEQIAAAEGAFATPQTMLGRLHWLLFRVGRALVDLRLHRRGWSIDQARAALIDWHGEPAYFAPFDTDLARIAREPGARAAEALAWLAIADRAPSSRRARRIYHGAVVAHGRKRLEALPRR